MSTQQSNSAVASNFNMKSITTKEYEEHLKFTMNFGGSMAVIGRRGGGKTLCCKSVVDNSEYKLCYLNLSVFERPDMGGYPDFSASRKGNYINHILPAFYESLIEGNKPCVALLDEVDKAERELWAPLLEFTQFRSINGRKLPNLKAIVMTGNLRAEGGERPCLPLLDRGEKYLLEPTASHWLEWAGNSGEIHPSITAYINDNGQDLFGEVDTGDNYADPSPRSWHNASKILEWGEKHKMPEHILTAKVAGCVGNMIGQKYASYYMYYHSLLPKVDKIMNGEIDKGFFKLEPSQQLFGCMIACSRLARLIDTIDRTRIQSQISNVGKFLKSVDPENVLMAVRSQIGLERVVKMGLDSDKHWDAVLDSLSANVE